MPKQIQPSEDLNTPEVHLSFYECHCSMNVIHPSNQLIEGFTRLCERCGGYIAHDKYEAWKQWVGISGYDEDNRKEEKYETE